MARDLYIDGRILVSGAKGHLNLGNPISLTQSIQNIIIPNVPVLAALPYTFQNGLTAVGSGPTVVSLGGTLLNNTQILGSPSVELEFSVDTIVNFAVDYTIDSNNANITTSDALSITNNAFSNGCNLRTLIQSQLALDTYLGGTSNTSIDGSKYVIENSTGTSLYLASGFYNYIEDCVPKSVMEQSIRDTSLSITGYSSVTTDGEVTLERFRDDSVNAISTKINLEGSVVIEAVNQTTTEFNRIITSTTTGVVIEGEDVVTGTYGYELPNTTPNNGDIMIADGAGKLLYEPNEIHIAAFNKISGVVGQLALFPVPFILNHVCTRIAFVAEAATNAGNISIDVVDVQSANNVLESAVIPISNAVSHWSGSVNLTGLVTTDIPRQLGIIITANTQGAPGDASLYLTMTFVRQVV